jgi:rhodanese-related sulfurtransferase
VSNAAVARRTGLALVALLFAAAAVAGDPAPAPASVTGDQVYDRLAEVPKDKDVVLYCRSGRRSALAGEVLAGKGYTRLQLMQGDMPGWVAKGWPVETPRDQAACVAALKSGAKAPPGCVGS